MFPLSPREIIEKVIYRYLCVVAIGNPLVQTVEGVPFLIGVPRDAGALARESPGGRVHHGRFENRCVSQGEALAVVRQGLLRSRSRQKWGLRIGQILQGAAPEQ